MAVPPWRIVICVILACFQTCLSLRKFPNNFSFGVSTASYQIEGSWNVSDKGENIWDHLTHHRSELVNDRSTGDVACDSYNQYKRDVEMLKELGVDKYRFSLSWSRICPSGFCEKLSEDGLRYYNNLIDELLSNGIKPVATIYHWDLPQSLQNLGGWTNPLIADYYEAYADAVFTNFGDRVKEWLTFNEPRDICQLAYGKANKAPALDMSGIADYLCIDTFLKSHARAYHLYRLKYKDNQKGRVGLTFSTHWYEPADDSPENIKAAIIMREFDIGLYAHPIFSATGDYPQYALQRVRNRSKEQGYITSRLRTLQPSDIDTIRGSADFFGINHYTTKMSKMVPEYAVLQSPSYMDDHRSTEYQLDSWEEAASSWLKVVPWGFRKLLNWVKDTFGNPEIIIYENGYSDRGELNDTARVEYYRRYLDAMLDAIDDGCNVTGYMAWTLMDNFEWLAGYTERFGLYHVDFNDPKRTTTPKNSAKYFQTIIKNKAL